VIIGVPSRDGAEFFMILLRESGPETRPDAASAKAGQGRAESPGGPTVVHKFMPSYPEELRRQGVAGRVELQVAIDEDGSVQGVKVTKPLHPYLDNAAVQAVKQWSFEPAFHEGRPASWIITIAVNFDPEAYRRQEEEAGDKNAARAGSPEEGTPAVLQAILDRGAEYCRKLAGSALDYICEEKINDVFYNFQDKESLAKSAVVVTMVAGDTIKTFGESFMPFHNPKKTERSKYICDYLIVKKGDAIEDKRIILEENGHKVSGREKLLEEKRFSALMPLLAPSRLLGKDRQSLFSYRLLKPDKIMGRRVHVVEALPKTRDGGGISSGKIWIDEKNSQILKIEIEGVPLEGYESVLNEITKYTMEPRFSTTYLYQIEKNGLMFPGLMEVRVGYPYPGSTEGFYLKKIRTDVTYGKYKFFTVETESRVIK
jgi:protein TonB